MPHFVTSVNCKQLLSRRRLFATINRGSTDLLPFAVLADMQPVPVLGYRAAFPDRTVPTSVMPASDS